MTAADGSGHPYPTYGALQRDLAWHREQLREATEALTAISALTDDVAGIDVPGAIAHLDKLLGLPTGDQLFPHVAVLREDLRFIRNLLVGAYGEGELVERDGPPRGPWARDDGDAT